MVSYSGSLFLIVYALILLLLLPQVAISVDVVGKISCHVSVTYLCGKSAF